MPDVMKAGLVMYVVSSALGLMSGLGGFPELSEEQVTRLTGIGCIALPLFAADIMGLVMACLGRAWGAILMTCTTVTGLVLDLAIAPMGIVGSGGSAIVLLTWIIGVASLACFIVPSAAWSYYSQSEAYRKSK